MEAAQHVHVAAAQVERHDPTVPARKQPSLHPTSLLPHTIDTAAHYTAVCGAGRAAAATQLPLFTYCCWAG